MRAAGPDYRFGRSERSKKINTGIILEIKENLMRLRQTIYDEYVSYNLDDPKTTEG